MSLYLSPLSNRLACCVTRLWPEAGFKHNHADREATRRHCHPLCPLPVAAAELLLTSPYSSLLTRSLSLFSLCRCSDTPSYLWCLLREGEKGGRKKTNTRPLKIEKKKKHAWMHLNTCNQKKTHRPTLQNIHIDEWVHTHTERDITMTLEEPESVFEWHCDEWP